ncbi:MAG: phosphoglucosamine mutase [Clostridiales bacterium]|nr:phosphoglucosamine mutase [Clostridiales bacterium]
MGKLFGTDGVRGIANKELTNELVYKLGRFGSYVLTKNSNKEKATILVAKDTRISGDMLENSLIAGILSAGNDAVKIDVVPTPTVAYLVRTMDFDAGVMISASHNSYEDNGIKFFNGDGLKLSDSIENKIEDYILNDEDIEEEIIGTNLGRVHQDYYLKFRYLEYIKSIAKDDFSGLNFAIDTANGAASELAPTLFRELNANVHVLNDKPDGININNNCGSTHLEGLSRYVIDNNLDFGLAFDGDADRLLAVDSKGNLVDGDKIMTICAHDMKEKNELKNDTIVVTVMSNIGFHKAMKENDLDVEVTKVGDRYVLEKMLEKDYSIGGEQSGHIIFLDHNTTGDGLLTAVKICNAVIDLDKPLDELSQVMKSYPQVLLNAKVSVDKKDLYEDHELINKRIQEISSELEGNGRILIRPSGTEPLVRVMLEGENLDILNKYAKELVMLFDEHLK